MSITIRPRININTAGVSLKINRAVQNALLIIANDIRKDCNRYAPHRRGTLISQSNVMAYADSSSTAKIRWGVPYASYVYKGISKSGKPLRYTKYPNANAQAKWCEKAKREHLSEWQKAAEKAIKDKYNEQQ